MMQSLRRLLYAGMMGLSLFSTPSILNSKPTLEKSILGTNIQKKELAPIQTDSNNKGRRTVNIEIKVNEDTVREILSASTETEKLSVNSYRQNFMTKADRLVVVTEIETFYSHNNKNPLVPSDGLIFYNSRTGMYDKSMPVFSRVTAGNGELIEGRTYIFKEGLPYLITGYFSPGMVFQGWKEAGKKVDIEKPLPVNIEFYQRLPGKTNVNTMNIQIDFSSMRTLQEGKTIKFDKNNVPVLIESK